MGAASLTSPILPGANLFCCMVVQLPHLPSSVHRYLNQIQDELTVLNRNLMAPDSFKNLGFGDSGEDSRSPNATSAQPSQPQGQDKPRGS